MTFQEAITTVRHYQAWLQTLSHLDHTASMFGIANAGLKVSGWSVAQLEEAFATIGEVLSTLAVPEQAERLTQERDALATEVARLKDTRDSLYASQATIESEVTALHAQIAAGQQRLDNQRGELQRTQTAFDGLRARIASLPVLP